MASKAVQRPGDGRHIAAVERVQRERHALAEIYWNGTLTQRARADESPQQQFERVQVAPTHLLLKAMEPIARAMALLTTRNRPADIAACRQEVLMYVLSRCPEEEEPKASDALPWDALPEGEEAGPRAFVALCQVWWNHNSAEDYSSFRTQVMHVIAQYHPHGAYEDLRAEALRDEVEWIVDGMLLVSPARPDASAKRMLLRAFGYRLSQELHPVLVD